MPPKEKNAKVTLAYQHELQASSRPGRIRRAHRLMLLPGTINLKTAKAIGLDVAPIMLSRADEVIE